MRRLMLHNVGEEAGRYTIAPSMLDMLCKAAQSIELTFDDGYRSVFDYLKGKDDVLPRVTVYLVAGLVGKPNERGTNGLLPEAELADWDLVRKFVARGVKIGSHGMTHRDLRGLPPSILRKEVGDSKRLIEDNIGCEITEFAYPYGYFDQNVIAEVKKNGYREAVTTSENPFTGLGNRFRRRRLEIRGDWPVNEMRRKLRLIYNVRFLPQLPRLLREKIVSGLGT